MASTSNNSPLPPEIGSKPLLVRFSNGEQESREIIDPFDPDIAKASLKLDILRGKQCLDCVQGEWLLMFDEGTKGCFLLSLASLCKIELPPLRTTRDLYMCALSSTTPSDCTIVFSTYHDKYLLYHRPGDDKWRERKLPVKFMGNIVSSRGGIMYSRTTMGMYIAIDVSNRVPFIKRRDIPHPSTMRWRSQESLVESDGDIFLLQFYIHGFCNSEVIDMDIHLLDTSAYVWNKVESIGDRTIFVGDNCVVLSSASRAGIQPGYIHLLHKYCRDGVRLYTIRVRDRTMTCTLLPGFYENTVFWVVTSSLKEKHEESLTLFSSESNTKINKLTFDEDVEHVAAPWSSLPVDMVEELVPRLSFIDYMNIREVCKRWSSISKPAQYAKRYPSYPVLMSICSSSAGTFKLFDPMIEKEYTLKNSSLVPCDDHFQMLLFAKYGWVLVLRGNRYMYATNPFTGEMLELPEMPFLGHQFDGISFSSSPKSPDCVVCAVEKERDSESILLYVMLWHAGDENWTRVKIYDHTQFRTAYSNPVFYRDKFYCLGTRGNLGVINPHNHTWRVLDKPDAILDGDPMPGDQYCHLLEFRDNLIAVFRPHNEGPIDLYRLDMSQMVWTKVERLDNEVTFVDNWNAIMMTTPHDTCRNRIYMSKLGRCNEGGESNSSAFYDLKSRKYYPSFFNLTERMNSIWVEPNFKSQ